MRPDPSQDTRRRLLFRLKTRGPQTAGELAEREELTTAAVRQHLTRLEEEGLVSSTSEAAGVGRPALRWSLTPEAEPHFPEGYADLAVELIESVRSAFGNEGLDQLTKARVKQQQKTYREAMPEKGAPLPKRVAALTKIRTREGYLAEWKRSGDALVLIENHCPVCAAAQVCQGICSGELDLFRSLLPDAKVERTEHMIDGARRCTYRITPRA